MSQVLSWQHVPISACVLGLWFSAVTTATVHAGNRPETVATLPNLQQPAGLAYDERSGDFYIGDAASGWIWRRDREQKMSQHAQLPADGPGRLEALALDPVRGWLWVIGAQAAPSSRPIVPAPAAALYRYALDSGALQQRYLLNEPGAWHHLGDLVVASNGDVYLSHSYERPAVYRLRLNDNQLALFWRGGPQVRKPFGIALDEAGGWLYLGHERGLLRIALLTADSETLTLPSGTAISSCTSLYFDHGHLLALNTGSGLLQRLTLTEASIASTVVAEPTRVLRSDILAVLSRQHFPPRAGLVVGADFLFLSEQLTTRNASDVQAQPVLQKLALPW